MFRILTQRYPMVARGSLLLCALAWLGACQPTRAPEQAPPLAPAAGQVVPVTPAPSPQPAPATTSPAPSVPPTSAANAVPPPPAAPPGNPSAKPAARKPTPARPATAAATAAAPKPAPAAAASASAAAVTPAPAAAPAAAHADPRPAAPSLDLASLEQRLRDTKAIGVFTKLSLKNQVDDLLDEVRQYHRNPSNPPQPVVRQHFEGLILKVLSSLQGGDPQLANTIASSREALWGILIDPDKFSKI